MGLMVQARLHARLHAIWRYAINLFRGTRSIYLEACDMRRRRHPRDEAISENTLCMGLSPANDILLLLFRLRAIALHFTSLLARPPTHSPSHVLNPALFIAHFTSLHSTALEGLLYTYIYTYTAQSNLDRRVGSFSYLSI